ncbi:hypothetical protein C8R42DRAFT_548668, partial [Lentinula raphanica]
RYSLVAAMSVDGYEAVQVIPGSLNAQAFVSFICDDVLPKMNPFPLNNSVLILDNCAIQKSRVLQEIID